MTIKDALATRLDALHQLWPRDLTAIVRILSTWEPDPGLSATAARSWKSSSASFTRRPSKLSFPINLGCLGHSFGFPRHGLIIFLNSLSDRFPLRS